MIRIGTSGFSYPDWVGTVYPAGLPAWEQLAFYAREFSTVEINMTYYRVPDKRTVEGWIRRTPDDFLFSVKAFQGLTHERDAPDFPGFVAAVRPLVEAKRLACVLAQFPYSFHPEPTNREYLARLRDGLRDLPVVIEFRDAGWVHEDTFALLRRLNLGFCSVDEPRLPGLMPPVAVATGPVAYVRFHGRNAAKWYDHKEAWQRYDYTYSVDELREWVPKLRQLDRAAPLTLVYFNNHRGGQAVRAARDLGQLLLLPEN
ncbi:MAG: DUF72 domain-containing protein [Anaerolineae bacterium]